MATLLRRPDPVAFDTDDDLHRLASARRDRVRFVNVPAWRYLALDGTDQPGSEGYQLAIAALFGTAYRLHFALKARGVAAPVGGLEGLYWLTAKQRMSDDATGTAPDVEWRWRMLIAVPPEATEDEVDAAVRAGEPTDMLRRLYLDRWTEGPSAPILHVGPYEAERPTLRRLADAITAAGLRPRGPHHEIYLNDPRRAGPDRTKTVLRQGVEAAV
jgi:hypothetical protein